MLQRRDRKYYWKNKKLGSVNTQREFVTHRNSKVPTEKGKAFTFNQTLIYDLITREVKTVKVILHTDDGSEVYRIDTEDITDFESLEPEGLDREFTVPAEEMQNPGGE